MTIGILAGIVCIGMVIGVLAAGRRHTAPVLVRVRPGRNPNTGGGNTR